MIVACGRGVEITCVRRNVAYKRNRSALFTHRNPSFNIVEGALFYHFHESQWRFYQSRSENRDESFTVVQQEVSLRIPLFSLTLTGAINMSPKTAPS